MVKMDLPSSDGQAASMKGLAASRIEGYNSAIAALAAFQGAGDLQGAAYDSGKTYGTTMITPLIQGAILLSEAVSEGATGLPKKYRAEVGGESLDSDILEAQIAAYESSLVSLRGSYRFLEKAEGTSAVTLKGMASRMSEISTAKNEAQDKLRKLYAFVGSSNAVFGNLPHIAEAMDMGISQISTEFANFSGTFQLPPADQLGWTQTIGVEWRKKESIDENYQKVLEKMERGEKLNDKDVKALQAYAERYPQRDLPDNVRDALEKTGQKQAKKVENTDAEKSVQELADKAGISFDDALNWILSGEKPVGVSNKAKEIYNAMVKYKKETLFINGRKIVVDSQGRVKIGTKQQILYSRNNNRVYKREKEFRRSTGQDDIRATDIGKGIQNTGWKNALGDAAKSAKSTFKSSLKVWDDFNWKNASELTKWGKIGKGLGALGTAFSVVGNFKENFFDDQVSSVGEKIRNFVVDQGVDTLSGAGASAAGAAIGTLIGGPIGTVAGLAVGAFVGWVMDQKVGFLGNKSTTDWAKDGLKAASDVIGDNLKTVVGWGS